MSLLKERRNGCSERCWARARRVPPRARRPRAAARLLLALSALLLAACSVDRPVASAQTPPTYALADPQTTRLGAAIAAGARANGAGSAASVVDSGEAAFATLRAMIALAEKTLDMQYYIWRSDRSGRTLLADLVQAADRGVRVRLLLDDMEVDWPHGELALIGRHPNLEVRLFNPFSRREGRILSGLFDFQRITHRMHNKAAIADNAVAMLGGRNVGDSYFDAHDGKNFRDIDLRLAGAVVREISHSFDTFWNSRWSVPIHDLKSPDGAVAVASPPTPVIVSAVRNGSGARVRPASGEAQPEYDRLARLLDGLVWTDRIRVFADLPAKLVTGESRLLDEISEEVSADGVRHLLIETSFLVPGARGLELVCSLVRRGVEVRILTNSLASIDSLAAFSGYLRYRRDLVDCGVDLYELRPGDGPAKKTWAWREEASASILHSKAAVIDRRCVFVGSFNFDPRSVYLNTEIALLLCDRRIAGRIAEFVERAMALERAWRLSLDDGDLVWTTREDGRTVHLTAEPQAPFWQQAVSWLLTLLPIERQL